jgi:hypothetical protein
LRDLPLETTGVQKKTWREMLTNSIDGALTFQQLRSAKHFLSVDEKFV